MDIKIEFSDKGIAWLTIDQPGQSMNVLHEAFMDELGAAVRMLAARKDLRGVVLASGKPDFIAGADLSMIAGIRSAQEARLKADAIKKVFRELELLPRPVVAILSGTTLGGGLELALACHHRIALANKKASFGLPEVSLGLLPGGGGTQRLIRLIGIEAAMPLLLEGKKLNFADAHAAKLIDAVAESPEALRQQAEAWILARESWVQPWDEKGFRWPGLSPQSPKAAQMLAVAPSMVNAKGGGHYPAPLHILSCVYEGMQLPFDQACRIESIYFAKCVESPVSKNLIASMWFQLNDIKKGGRRPKDVPPASFRKVGVIGAGMMGAGIAYASADAGLEVCLKDSSLEQAEKGKQYSAGVLAKRQQRGSISADEAQVVLDRIRAVQDTEGFRSCDLAIEAVFEDRALKANVTREIERELPQTALFGSNTSTLPISGLAEASERPEQFIGLHFFSPVDRMQLVEIIAGKKTSRETIAKAYDFVSRIRKVPILVNDSRGFYTSRCFKTYVIEGLALLSEGQSPQLVEAAGKRIGMPVGPLTLTDELSLDLLASIQEQTKKDLAAEGKAPPSDVGFKAVGTMLSAGRRGRKAGAGFYDYSEGNRKKLWAGLAESFPAADAMPFEDLMDRMLFIQSIEAVRCLEENVVTSVADANIGSIFGWGFPAFHGGILQFINSFGPKAFLERAEVLAKRYGERFAPPELLRKKVSAAEGF